MRKLTDKKVKYEKVDWLESLSGYSSVWTDGQMDNAGCSVAIATENWPKNVSKNF